MALGISGRICAGSLGLRSGYGRLGCLLHSAMHGLPRACLQPTWLAGQAPAAAAQTCMRWQVALLLLPGFTGATWAVFRSERRIRLGFLHAARDNATARAMPTDLGFLLNFAVPATLAMWLYAR